MKHSEPATDRENTPVTEMAENETKMIMMIIDTMIIKAIFRI